MFVKKLADTTPEIVDRLLRDPDSAISTDELTVLDVLTLDVPRVLFGRAAIGRFELDQKDDIRKHVLIEGLIGGDDYRELGRGVIIPTLEGADGVYAQYVPL